MPTETSTPQPSDQSIAPEAQPKPATRPAHKHRWRLIAVLLLLVAALMAIRSLRDIWVDANFKETQLRNLRIGQRVDLEVDMYGGKRAFEGRISGFTMGTGSTLALLPAQNATGNFVKVVQRLPVRIDVMNYDPDRLPLFVGLSVTPTVDLKTTPSGPNAGMFLQEPGKAGASATPTP